MALEEKEKEKQMKILKERTAGIFCCAFFGICQL